jgi:hypothetical protein
VTYTLRLALTSGELELELDIKINKISKFISLGMLLKKEKEGFY